MAANDDLKEAKKLLEELNALRRKLDQKPIKLTEEETIRQLQDLPKDIERARKALSDMEGSATNLYDRLRGVTSELKGQETTTTGIRKAFRSLTADVEKLKFDEQEITKLSAKELTSLQKRVKENQNRIKSGTEEIFLRNTFAKKLDEEVKAFRAIGEKEEHINVLISQQLKTLGKTTAEEKAILSTYFDQDGVLGDINEKVKLRLKDEEKINKQIDGFTALKDLSNSIPGLRKLSGPFEAAEAAARDAAEAGGSGLKSFAAGGQALLKAFGPLAVAITAFKFLKDVAFGVSKSTTEIGKSMGISSEASRDYYEQLKGIEISSNSNLVTTTNLLGAQTELTKTIGVTRGYTEDQLKDQVVLTKQMGIQAEQASKLQQLSMLNNQSADASVDAIIKQSSELAKQTGIQFDNREVIKEVAEATGQVAANLGNNPSRIAQAVIQTKKLGLTLAQAAGMSSNLLDFESSISAEMEAELLTGKDLNFEKARSLALQGDVAAAAAEVAKQAGSLAEFQSMNVIAQKALASAAGLTVDELATSLAYQENINKLGQQTKKQVEDRIKLLNKEGKVAEANKLAQSIGNEEDAKAALEKIDAQEAFNAALDKAKSMFTNLFSDAGGLAETIVGMFEGINSALPIMKGLLVGLGVAAALWAASMIPAAIAAVTAMSAMTLGIGAVAIAAGIYTAVQAMDSSTEKSKTSINDGMISSDGGLVVSGPKGSIDLNRDDSIIAGTDLMKGGSNSNSNSSVLIAQIDKLIKAVERGGNVYMDGNKVGEAILLSSFKSS